jgi:hypothetical protein
MFPYRFKLLKSGDGLISTFHAYKICIRTKGIRQTNQQKRSSPRRSQIEFPPNCKKQQHRKDKLGIGAGVSYANLVLVTKRNECNECKTEPPAIN